MKEKAWHRRHALQLASQLPETYEDAMAVIRATERLANEYLKDPENPSDPGKLIRLREV